jgi:hypothetical protein
MRERAGEINSAKVYVTNHGISCRFYKESSTSTASLMSIDVSEESNILPLSSVSKGKIENQASIKQKHSGHTTWMRYTYFIHCHAQV